MFRTRVLIKQIISPDGKMTVVAKGVAIASGDREGKSSQTVKVTVSFGNKGNISSTSSSASRTK